MPRTNAPGRMPPRSPARPAAKAAACAAVLAALVLLVPGCGGERSASPADSLRDHAHVLLVTLDTTRPDRLGVYGHDRDTSPHLDRLAKDATVYTRAYSTSSWTLPAHASLFTGKITYAHGARYDPEGPLILAEAIDGIEEVLTQYRARGLAPDQATLAGRLREAGFATGGFVAGPWLERIFGLDSGFDHWDDEDIDEANGRPAVDVTDRALAWLARQSGPTLTFLNYFDPHAPYVPPERFVRELFGDREPADARDLYDAEIRSMDHHFGRVLDFLREHGLYERTWIVVTADHGELFGEHGLKVHGRGLWEQEIHVPLIVKAPAGEGAPGTRDDTVVQVTDVMPMLLEGLGLPLPEGIQGRAERAGEPVVAELHPLPLRGDPGDLRALVGDRYKLLWRERGAHQLFDLEADPGEANNRAFREPEVARALRADLDAFLATVPQPERSSEGPGVRVDDQTRRALEGLGYLESDEAPASPDAGQDVP